VILTGITVGVYLYITSNKRFGDSNKATDLLRPSHTACVTRLNSISLGTPHYVLPVPDIWKIFLPSPNAYTRSGAHEALCHMSTCSTVSQFIFFFFLYFQLGTAAFKAYCAIWVRRSNFRHQASPRVSPRESTQQRKVELWASNVR